MITTADALIGFEITSSLGPIEAVIEKSFAGISVQGVGFIQGGGLSEMLFEAKQLLAKEASVMGAGSVIACRYALVGRELEKSVIAYGTAVKCRRQQVS